MMSGIIEIDSSPGRPAKLRKLSHSQSDTSDDDLPEIRPTSLRYTSAATLGNGTNKPALPIRSNSMQPTHKHLSNREISEVIDLATSPEQVGRKVLHMIPCETSPLILSDDQIDTQIDSDCTMDGERVESDMSLPAVPVATTTFTITKEAKRAAAEEKKKLKEAAKAAKAAEKERQAIEKSKAKSIAAVNRLKKSKKDCTPEIIIDICKEIKKTAIGNHINDIPKALGCTVNYTVMAVPGLVTFRRRCTSRYDANLDHYIPLPEEEIVSESQSIVLMKATQFQTLAGDPTLLSDHVTSVRAARPDAQVLYLIEGVQALIRKGRTAKNRAFTAAVRSGNTISSSELDSRPDDQVDEELLEDALLDLQILHKCLIVHSTSPKDTADHLSVLVSDISTIPYKLDKATQFCTEVGQIKTGNDVQDTLEKMLMQTRNTQPVARAIAAKYRSIPRLYEALKDDQHALANLPKMLNKDHSVSGSAIGNAVSQRVWRAIIPRDPHLEV